MLSVGRVPAQWPIRGARAARHHRGMDFALDVVAVSVTALVSAGGLLIARRRSR